MEIQKLKISKEDRLLVSIFMGEDYPFEVDFNWLMLAWKKFNDEVINTEWYKDEHTKESSFELDCMEHSLCTAHIQGAFKHFINLINWYHSQQTQPT